MGFGVRAEREATLTSGFSIHTQPQTDNPRSHQLTDPMRKRRGFTYSVSVMWNTVHFPHFYWWNGERSFDLLQAMASLLSEKHGQTYSTTMAWLRCVLSFPFWDHPSYASEDICQLLEDLQKQHHFCLWMSLELRACGFSWTNNFFSPSYFVSFPPLLYFIPFIIASINYLKIIKLSSKDVHCVP